MEPARAELEFFSRQWWQAVAEAWNASGERGALAGIGTVRFELASTTGAAQYLAWDESGTAQLVPAPEGAVPTFEATARDWRSFIAGEFTAVQGVMARRIRFRGRLRSILPYSLAFNRLAVVSQVVPTAFPQAK